MARPRNQDLVLDIPSFHGGFQGLTDPDKLEPHQAWQFLDCILDEVGTASGRLGSQAITTIGGGTARVLSSFLFERAGAAKQVIVHLDDGTLRYASGGVGSWTTIASGLSTTAPFSYHTFVSNVWMANGVDDFRKWDGTTQTTYASVPKFKYIEAWKDGLWGAGEASNPDRVYASAAGDGTTWPASDFVDINKGSGLGISGLSSDANALVIFKTYETHALYDPVEFTNRIVDPEKGCMSSFSVIKHNGVIYFMSHQGYCQYLGDAPSTILSQNIQPIFDKTLYDLSFPVYGYTFKNRIGWSYRRLGGDDVQVEYYPQMPETPWAFNEVPVRAPVSYRDPLVEELLYAFSTSSNQIVRLYSNAVNNDFDGSSVNGWIKTGWFDFDAPVAKKHIQRMLFIGRGIFAVQAEIDYEGNTPIFVAFVGSGGHDFEEFEVFTDIYCRSFRLFINGTATLVVNRKRTHGEEQFTDAVGPFSISSAKVFAKLCGDGR